MIGLKNGLVVVSDYDPSWVSAFESERALIQKALPGSALVIEHIGSTSVPGLCAKPVIDILIGIKNFDDGFNHVESKAPFIQETIKKAKGWEMKKRKIF